MDGSAGGDSADERREVADPDAAAARIRERAEAVREGQVETALAQLEARGDVSPAERRAVEELADRLVERLVAVPERGLRAAAETGDDEAVETALSLFG